MYMGTNGLIMWSRNDEMDSVVPLQPLTSFGLIPWAYKYVVFLPCGRDVGWHVCKCLYSLLLSCCLLFVLCHWLLPSVVDDSVENRHTITHLFSLLLFHILCSLMILWADITLIGTPIIMRQRIFQIAPRFFCLI